MTEKNLFITQSFPYSFLTVIIFKKYLKITTWKQIYFMIISQLQRHGCSATLQKVRPASFKQRANLNPDYVINTALTNQLPAYHQCPSWWSWLSCFFWTMSKDHLSCHGTSLSNPGQLKTSHCLFHLQWWPGQCGTPCSRPALHSSGAFQCSVWSP